MEDFETCVFFSSKITFVPIPRDFMATWGGGQCFDFFWSSFFLKGGTVLSLCVPEDDRVDGMMINY